MGSLCIYIRAVSVNALIYVINAAVINAITFFFFFNAFISIGHEVMTGSEAEKRWGDDWELHQARLGLPFYWSDEGQVGLEKAPLFKVGNDRKSLRTTGLRLGSLLFAYWGIISINDSDRSCFHFTHTVPSTIIGTPSEYEQNRL